MNPRWKKAALTSVAAATIALTMPATDASAIGRVSCAGRWDFVNVFTTSGTLCFAGRGYTDVTIYNVSDLYSGNNDLYYYNGVSSPSGSGTRHLLPWTWQSTEYYDAGNRGTVRWLQSF